MAHKIVSVNGTTYEILEKQDDITKKMVPFLIGKGGQGSVYKAKNVATGELCALKLYPKKTPPEFNKNLKCLADNGSPHEAFVWVQELLPARQNGAIGFKMDLYDNTVFHSFKSVAIKAKHTFSSRRAQLNALIELASAFEALHAKGYCFQDINEGAIVFDVKNGRVRICDCENVAPEGARIPMGYNESGEYIYMQGYPRYMAPEVEIRAMLPDKYTDRYSLAVMMFMVLTCCHPLEGKKRFTYNSEGYVDANVKRDIYGKNPIYIFDLNNSTNRPHPEVDNDAIRLWPEIPQFIKDLFQKAFTMGMPSKGIYDESKKQERCNRPTEKQWREAFIKWMDLLVTCEKCGHSFAADLNPTTMQLSTVCPSAKCRHNNNLQVPRMKVYKRVAHRRTVLLVPGREIPLSTISDSNSFESAMIVGRGKAAGVFAVKNLTNNVWTCVLGTNSVTLAKNEFVQIKNGMKIIFDFEFSVEIVM